MFIRSLRSKSDGVVSGGNCSKVPIFCKMIYDSILANNFVKLLCFLSAFGVISQAHDGYHHPISIKSIQRSKREASIFNEEKTSTFWIDNAQDTLHQKIWQELNTNEAKNVILFLGDGMSIPTLAAARIYKGQLDGGNGERSHLSFEEFPYTGLSKTYCVDKQVADSACTATAYLCGIKSNYATIGVKGNVALNDCPAGQDPDNQVSSIAKWAQDAGKYTGIVTTTTVTNASPAGTYAHVANREYESDYDVHVYNQTESCQDIAKQLVMSDPGKNFKVILGGGRTKFTPHGEKDEEGVLGERRDGVNLAKYWQRSKTAPARYVWDRNGLLETDFNKTEYLLGLFQPGHLDYHLDSDRKKQPTLEEMTETAIRILQKSDMGFFLFVEGGRIDHGHHDNLAVKALDETVEFSKAVQKALDMTNAEETLIVVTSDHAHTMSISGYADRGSPIQGLNTEESNMDQLPYTTLSYANGPSGGYFLDKKTGLRSNLRSSHDVGDKDFKYPSIVPLKSETHGGDDVAIFANGPWSHLFTGVMEQNTIPHLMAYASCIGNERQACIIEDK